MKIQLLKTVALEIHTMSLVEVVENSPGRSTNSDDKQLEKATIIILLYLL